MTEEAQVEQQLVDNQTVIGVIYFVAIYPITLFSYWLERRQRRSA